MQDFVREHCHKNPTLDACKKAINDSTKGYVLEKCETFAEVAQYGARMWFYSNIIDLKTAKFIIVCLICVWIVASFMFWAIWRLFWVLHLPIDLGFALFRGLCCILRCFRCILKCLKQLFKLCCRIYCGCCCCRRSAKSRDFETSDQEILSDEPELENNIDSLRGTASKKPRWQVSGLVLDDLLESIGSTFNRH